MHDDGDRLGSPRTHCLICPSDHRARIVFGQIGCELVLDDGLKRCAFPMWESEQIVRVGQCLNAPHDRGLDLCGTISLRQAHHRLHNGQEIFSTVINLATKKGDERFLALAFRDIAGDFWGADYSAFFIPDGGNGERDIDECSILAPANRIIVLDALSPSNAVKDHSFFVFAVWRYENGNRFSSDFFSRIAEYSLGSFVPGDNTPIQVFADNCVVRRLHNCCEPLSMLLANFAIGGGTILKVYDLLRHLQSLPPDLPCNTSEFTHNIVPGARCGVR